MKKIFIKKVINAIAAAGLLFAVLSCSNSVKTEQKNEGVALRINVTELANVQASEKNAESVTEADSKARTVTPDLNNLSLSNLTDFVFSGAQVGGTLKEIQSFATFADLQAAEIVVPFDTTQNDWNFTISAKYGNVVFYGKTTTKLSYDLKEGEKNTINFALYLNKLGSGNGSFSLTFNLPNVTDSNYIDAEDGRVTGAEAQLYDMQGNVVQINGNNEAYYNIQDNNPLVFSAADIPAGNYRAKVEFWFEDCWAAYWQEIIQVAEGVTSTTEQTIERTDKFYRIIYNLNGGNENSFYPCEAFIAGEDDYDIYEMGFNPKKENNVFIGWYTDSSMTKPLTFPLKKDTEVWAKWESSLIPDDHSYYPATIETLGGVVTQIDYDIDHKVIDENSVSKPVVLKILGDINPYDSDGISEIRESLDYYNKIYFTLDLSLTRNLSDLYSGSDGFEGVENLVEIILPDSVRNIYDDAFYGCSNLSAVTIGAKTHYMGSLAFASTNLKTITLSPENEYFVAVNNVLYSSDMTELFVYPLGSDATSFTIPASVKFIEYGAFYGVKNLETVYPAYKTDSWYRNSTPYFPGEEALIRYSTKCEPLDVSDLANGGTDRLYKLTKDECDDYLAGFFGDTTEFTPVTVYTSQSFNVSPSAQEPYIIATANANDYTFFKMDTEPGVKYTIDFCTAGNKYSFDNVPDDLALTTPTLYVFSTDGKEITYLDYYTTYDYFTAVGDVTYLGVYGDYDVSCCAFHVWEHEVRTGFNITVNPLSDDIMVTTRTNTLYGSGGANIEMLLFNVTGFDSYDSYEWYLDDVKDTNYNDKSFSVTLGNNLTSGAHTVMLIATKDGKYYSYTAQIWKD